MPEEPSVGELTIDALVEQPASDRNCYVHDTHAGVLRLAEALHPAEHLPADRDAILCHVPRPRRLAPRVTPGARYSLSGGIQIVAVRVHGRGVRERSARTCCFGAGDRSETS